MLYLFDTSALQHRYIDGVKARGIRRTISSTSNTCYIASVSMLEIASTFANHCRKSDLNLATYRRLDRLFWKDVQMGRLAIRDCRLTEVRRALHLLEYAGAHQRRNLGTQDALIAATALELALEKNQQVTFCLEDWGLFDIVRRIAAYQAALRFRFIGTLKTKEVVQRLVARKLPRA